MWATRREAVGVQPYAMHQVQVRVLLAVSRPLLQQPLQMVEYAWLSQAATLRQLLVRLEVRIYPNLHTTPSNCAHSRPGNVRPLRCYLWARNARFLYKKVSVRPHRQ